MPDAVSWTKVANGFVALGHRPKLKALRSLAEEGTTHVVTLLSEREGARDVGQAVEKAGMRWLWLSLENGDPPPEERTDELRARFHDIERALDEGGRILINCSAGIHRTGMIAHALLRFLRFAPDEAKTTLATLRAITARDVGDERLGGGERFGRP